MEARIHPQEFLRAVFEELNDAIVVFDIQTSEVVLKNKKVFDLFGFTENCDLDFIMDNCLPAEPPYNLDNLREYACKAVNGFPQVIEWKVKHNDGYHFWIELSFKRAVLEDREYLIVVIRNINRLKQENEDSEARFRELVESLPEVVYEIDTQANLRFCNNAALDFFGVDWEEVEAGINVLDYVAVEDRKKMIRNMEKVIKGELITKGTEYTLIKKDGTRIPVILHSKPIIKNGYHAGFRGFIVDVTKLKENEEKLLFMSGQDLLTGLHNRNYFEQEMHRLNGANCKVMFVLYDIDGLKTVNDTKGHCAGDQILITTANIILRSFHNRGLVARIGSDEFAVLLKDGDCSLAQEGIFKVTQAVEEYNRNLTEDELPLSLSMGIAYNHHPPVNPWALFKEADNNMARQKLYHSQSTRSAIVQTLMKALEARDFITEGHADRLSKFVSCLARSLDLPDQKVTDLCLLAHFHDLGKVGVPDRLLFKKGTFTPEEFAEMQKHCEIGYRIAKSSPDLAPIADWILKHHEWWNGQGYPVGLKGEEIPLECRILSIADAYDAMTNDRPYREAMTPDEAVKELQRCAGLQFDPELVDRFVSLLPDLLG